MQFVKWIDGQTVCEMLVVSEFREIKVTYLSYYYEENNKKKQFRNYSGMATLPVHGSWWCERFFLPPSTPSLLPKVPNC